MVWSDGSWAVSAHGRHGASHCTGIAEVGHNAAVHPSVEAALPQIRELCQRLGVARLDLFGSASGTEPAENPGDVDVLVRFGPVPPGELFTTYFALKEGLEAILRRPVDVVSIDRLENPYVRRSVLAQREELYAA